MYNEFIFIYAFSRALTVLINTINKYSLLMGSIYYFTTPHTAAAKKSQTPGASDFLFDSSYVEGHHKNRYD